MGLYPQSHISSFINIRPLVLEKKIFEGILPYKVQEPKSVATLENTFALPG